MALKNKKCILVLIILIAAFFRFYQLDIIPKGLYHDEAINGNDAFSSLIDGNYRIFYPENNGREGLFVWFTSLSFSIFGVSIWSLRFIPALIGALTVLGLYLFAKELFSLSDQKHRAEDIALLSSFFLAISFWHTNFSRIAFRAILVPFVLVYSFYFLIKGFRRQKTLYLEISGTIFGLGFYTYTVFRLSVLLLLTILFLFWINYKKQSFQKKFFLNAFYFLLAILIIAFPLGIYFLSNPQYFFGRTGQVSVLSQPDTLKSFAQSILVHLGMFNFYGDTNWRHNLSASPQLLLPMGILFLIGLLFSIKRFKRGDSEFRVYVLLLAWFLFMLLPGALTWEGIPHSLRTIGTIPAVYIFASLGCFQFHNWLNNKTNNKKLFSIVCFLFLIFLTFYQFQKYFILWAQNPQTEEAFSYNHAKIGNYLNSLPDETQKIIVVNTSGIPVPYPDGIPMPAQSIMFVENTKYGKIRSLYLLEENLDEITVNQPTVIIPMQYDGGLFEKMKILFPQGMINNKDGIIFYEVRP